MSFFRVSTLLALSAAIFSGGGLFWTSQNVQHAEEQLRDLRHASQKEAQALRVLHAEWDYLNRPDRLEVLAQDYLGYAPLAVENVMDDAARLPEFSIPALPPHKPSLAPRSAVYKAPAAKVRPPVNAVPQTETLSADRRFQTLLDELNQTQGGEE